ncbi:hypothetical protein [Cellulosimicrobium funkei]|uniref:hypothetical protein n=1 Tax=Cellulosimicrobium funkei TaxID=264251 RepID=UPI0037DD9E8F
MTTKPNNYVLTDENGIPTGVLDVDRIQAQATRLAYDMAVYSDDPTMLEQVSTQHLAEAGTEAFGYVAASALRILAEHILEPVLMVTDRLHKVGALHHDLRAGLEDAADNARETLR